MKKKILLILVTIIALLTITGCKNSKEDNTQNNSSQKELDHKVYKYMK